MKLPKLRVSSDSRILETETGTPFFYLADTVWCMFQRMTYQECDLYFQTRAAQSFNAFQVVALSEEDGLRTANRYNHLPFVDLDPARPVEEYWLHIDRVIALAEEAGLYTALLPTWGDKFNKKWGIGPEIFTPANAGAYGAWIAQRYKDRAIIWTMGGDRALDTDEHRQIVRNMAEGVRSVVGQSQLITFHPAGGTSSSNWVQDETWLDFHMLQSGHTGLDNANWEMISHDRALSPTRPVMDGEPNYENHPVMSTRGGRWAPTGYWFTQHDVRKTAWRSALSGACGYTYGCHDIWQCYEPGVTPPKNFARTCWREAIELPGAQQVRHVKQWMQQIGLPARIEAAAMTIGAGDLSPAEMPIAGRASDGRFAFIYLPCTGSYEFDLSTLVAPTRCTWISPVTGDVLEQHTINGKTMEVDNDGPLDLLLLVE